ncbi:AMP-binding protein, partial [Chloroflexota bacterium]
MASRQVLRELSRYQIGTYADVIYRNALLYANQEAFIYGKERITFAEYNARVNSLVHSLQSLGVKKNEVIGISSWNSLEYVIVIGAAMKGGFLLSPYNPRVSLEGLDYLINYSEANTLFVGPESVEIVTQLRPRLPVVKNFISLEEPAPDMLCNAELLAAGSREEPDVQVQDTDPLYILYTSGTTGVPRGALYSHGHSIHDIRTRMTAMPLAAGDRHVLILPLFHIAGMQTFQAFLYVGGTNIIMSSFDPKATLQTIQDEKATDLHIVPTNLAAIFAIPDFEKYDLSSLKGILYAASPMPVALLKRGMDIWGSIFCQFYGQTESGPLVSCLNRKQHQVAYGSPEEQKLLVSIGQPCLGVHV